MSQTSSYRDYVPNPWPPTTPGSPCDNTEATPQKICGTVTTSSGGSPTEVNWVQLAYTTSGTPNAATALSGSELLVRRASIGGPATNAAAVSIGPNNSANADSIGVGQYGYVIEMPDGTAFDLAAWYAKSTSASQALVILYLPA